MPAKGKHHLSHQYHHHPSQQQQHQQHPQHQQHSHQHPQHLVNVHQTGGAGTPQSYNTVVATTRGYVSHGGSDFHVPGQSYGAQAGGQVGGGGGNIGVSGARGPPSLGNIQSISQNTPLIQSGSGASGNQQQSQTPTPGVQQQQPPGPVSTTTPPIHTPSPQEMGKPVHHPTQPLLPQQYIPNQARPVPHGFYQMGPRPAQSRSSAHRSNQGGGTTHVVGMPSVGGSTGQPPAMYSHHTNINMPATPTMFVQSQVPNIHTGPHQSPMYPVNSQMSQIAFPSQPRHQGHQGQQYFTGYPTHTLLPSMFPFGPGPTTPLTAYCYPPHHPPNTAMNLTRANANAVSGGATHVGGALAGAQTNVGISQATLQQPTQQPQTIPPMAISLPQSAYTGHNGGVTNPPNTTYQKVVTRPNALMNIVDPVTGKNVAHDIYRDAAIPNDESRTPQQDSAIVAEFASLVAKAASEDSETNSSSSASNVQENHQKLSSTQPNSSNPVVQNFNKSQSDSRDNVPIDLQCNLISPAATDITVNSASCPLIDMPERKSVVIPMQDVVEPICNTSPVDNITLSPLYTRCANKDDDPSSHQSNAVIQTNTVDDAKFDSQLKKNSASTDSQTADTVSEILTSTTTPIELHSSKESTHTTKSSSNSPSRRKSRDRHQQPQPQTHQHGQISSNSNVLPANACTPEVISTGAESEEKKVSAKGVSICSPTSYNNTHEKANGEPSGDKLELEPVTYVDCSQKSTDGKAMQKQKNKNKLKGRDLNRKGAEKEGTDMDAFVNQPLQPTKIDEKVQEVEKESHSQTAPIILNVDQQQTKQEAHQPHLEVLSHTDESKDVDMSKNETSDVKSDTESEQEFGSRSSSQHQTEKNLQKSNETVASEIVLNNPAPVIGETIVPSENDMVTSRQLPFEDSDKCVQISEKTTKDVVDHVKTSNTIDVEAIVAQKNEENSKVSNSHREASETNSSLDDTAVPVVDKHNENESVNQHDITPKSTTPTLKYQYNADQWSPRNPAGKKEYDREFLIKVQEDPRCRVRPSTLPDIEAVVKDCSRQISRNTVDMRIFKDTRAHEHLLPMFAKSPFSAKAPITARKSGSIKTKAIKSNLIHVSLSLREDVKLRESENAWKPTRLKGEAVSEEDVVTETLYKKVRSVLNKLTPQKFNTLVNQVRSLKIDTEGRLQGVIDLVFEKSVDEPSFSVAYANMCKEISYMKVPKTDSSQYVTFNKLLITRCQVEFEKNAVDEMARVTKLREIETCVDSEKKKELQQLLEVSDRQMRVRSVGIIRFIGELYKQEMLTDNIMNKCIAHLLNDIDEENLECLCKLLTTIGKKFERVDKDSVETYFTGLANLASRKNNKKISSRVRFMIQDVIDLRQNNWIPRRDESNPKTIDQILKDAESERIEIQLNNTPRRDERNSEKRRNRATGSNDGGWSAPVGKTRQTYAQEMSKYNSKQSSMDDLQLGSRTSYVWGPATTAGKLSTLTPNKYALLETISLDQDKRPFQLPGSRSTGSREQRSEYKSSWDGRGSRNGSHQMGSSLSSREGLLMENSRNQISSMPPPSLKFKSTSQASMANSGSNTQPAKPPKTNEQILGTLMAIFNKANLKSSDEAFIETAVDAMGSNFDNASYQQFIETAINTVLERDSQQRRRFTALVSHMIKNNMITLSLFQDEYMKLINIATDLVIDIPKVWTYFAEILSEMVVAETHPLSELSKTLAIIRNNGSSGKLLGELLKKLANDQGPKWVKDKWHQSGLKWSDVIDTEQENLDKIIETYNLGFIINGCSNSDKPSSGCNLSFDEIHKHLLKLMRDSNFDNITSWITVNVGDVSKQPQFIRGLITAILKISIESHNHSWRLNSETFKSLLPLITRYVDAEPQLELQCLYAIQAHIYELMHPQGVLGNIIDALCEGGIISDDAFLAWQKSEDPAEMQGHAIAVKALTSFFVNLQETRDESSEEA